MISMMMALIVTLAMRMMVVGMVVTNKMTLTIMIILW